MGTFIHTVKVDMDRKRSRAKARLIGFVDSHGKRIAVPGRDLDITDVGEVGIVSAPGIGPFLRVGSHLGEVNRMRWRDNGDMLLVVRYEIRVQSLNKGWVDGIW